MAKDLYKSLSTRITWAHDPTSLGGATLTRKEAEYLVRELWQKEGFKGEEIRAAVNRAAGDKALKLTDGSSRSVGSFPFKLMPTSRRVPVEGCRMANCLLRRRLT